MVSLSDVISRIFQHHSLTSRIDCGPALQALEKTLEETDPPPAAVPAVSMFSTAAVQQENHRPKSQKDTPVIKPLLNIWLRGSVHIAIERWTCTPHIDPSCTHPDCTSFDAFSRSRLLDCWVSWLGRDQPNLKDMVWVGDTPNIYSRCIHGSTSCNE